MQKLISKIALTLIIAVLPAFAFAQFSFTNANSTMMPLSHYHSGCTVTVLDWNKDGLDDLIVLDLGHDFFVEIQNANGTFTTLHIADFAAGSGNGWAWGMAAADFDHNGYADVVAGVSPVYIIMTDANGQMGSTITLPSSVAFLQNVTLGDFNNDGWIDIFNTNDVAPSQMYMNDGAGNFPSVSSLINFALPNGSDNSGNYGSNWSDFDSDGDMDFYIAKCRQMNIPPTDYRRRDVLFMNDGSYNFSAYTPANTQYWSDSLMTDGGAQTWTCNFADLDNDGDLDIVRVNYNEASQIMINDGTGHFTDATAGSGFNVSNIFGIESVCEDFDNDGYNDILVTGYHDIFFHNNGNMTFTESDDIILPGSVGSFAIGDLNHDGAVDIYASYTQVYTTPTSTDDVVYLNDNHTNNWVTFNLVGTVSNHGAVGARVTLYGAWGKQVREIHAGESYGTCNSTECHFGLGAYTTIDSAVIHFPSGIVNKLYNISANQFITNVETGCAVQSANITYTGSPVICPGQTITLTAPAGFSYLWFDGSTNQSIDISNTGTYSVQISNGSCAVNTPGVQVTNDLQNAPVVSTADPLKVCLGTSVILTSTSAASYTWSNGDTTQSITVTVGGTYSVSIPGTGSCPLLNSNDIVVNVIDVTEPTGTDDFINTNTTATLQATGTDVRWFDMLTGGTELGDGNSFTTPVLTSTTTYYAEDRISWGGGGGEVGEMYHTGNQLYSSGNATNGSVNFNTDSACILKTVKVITDSAGTRRIVLKDNSGNIVDSLSVYVPVDSTVITLNFTIPVGNGFSLTTDATVNQASFGFTSPRFQRSNIQGAGNYPYVLNGIATLTGNNAGNGYYYYFYDMHFEKPITTCTSDRTAVTAHVSTGISSVDDNIGVDVFPNPSEGMFTVQTNFKYNHIEVLDLLGRKVFSNNKQVNQLNLSNFNKGTYILQLTDANNQTVRRQLVIE